MYPLFRLPRQTRINHLKKCLYFACILLSGNISNAQSTTDTNKKIVFVATISQDTVNNAQSFNVSFTLNAIGENFVPPSFDDFIVRCGSFESTTYSVFRGYSTQKAEYQYTLKAKENGSFKLGKASIIYSGVTYETNELHVTVDSKKAPPVHQMNAYSNILFYRQASDKNISNTQGFLIDYKVILEKDINRMGFDYEKLPEYKGFESTREFPKRFEAKDTIYKGKEARSILVFTDRIFPSKKGLLEDANTTLKLCIDAPTGTTDLYGARITKTISLDIELAPSEPIYIELD